ncbi:equilibrative nucleoside transporter 4 [Onthophagus taurus]|uniref:equilibrative nucleoside transporter 4 n=1 Tax=Onthophagus taurus TaxID=166361 RepID=UPI000C2021E8|nr:equilibrative nucleoside transporter 4 [Onthophagus taurus]
MEQNGNDAAGYSKLGKCKRENDFHVKNGFTSMNLSPPTDTYNMVYLSFVLGGAGFLFPYNSFIMAMDYFKIRYPGTPVVFDMSLVYIVVAFLTVVANNLLVEICSLNTRINFGYVMSFITLTFVVTCEVWWEAFGTSTSYTINLAAVAVVAIGCTVQQSSFYGYTSMLPSRYTQAVMVGESASGVFTSSVRVLTKFVISEIRGSTIYFFSVSITSVATCFAMYHLVRRSDFIQFYITLCERAKTRITLEPTEDAGLIETTDAQYGVLKIQNSPPTSTTLSFANPAYEPSVPAPTYKVEDVVIRGRSSVSAGGGFTGIKRGLLARWEITKAIYPYMISICLVYFATLCLYPGIASEIWSCNLRSWMPILMMAIFNGADLLGKMLAASSWHWTGSRLVRCSVARLIMIPLMLMCVIPKANPLLSAEIFAFVFALILGLSNGVLGSVPMIQAPSKVDDRHRELTGNMMTLLYNFGLTTGSLMAYSLESLTGPADFDPCTMRLPTESLHPQNVINTTIFPTTITYSTLLSTLTNTSTEFSQ